MSSMYPPVNSALLAARTDRMNLIKSQGYGLVLVGFMLHQRSVGHSDTDTFESVK